MLTDKGRSSGVGRLERTRLGAKNTKMMWGTTRALLYNMVRGVSLGYRVELNMVGVGYRASYDEKNRNLVLKIGYCHDVIKPIPEDITCRVPKADVIRLAGIDKYRVMKLASEIRGLKRPEPYKGKGIRYKGEQVTIKAVKKK